MFFAFGSSEPNIIKEFNMKKNTLALWRANDIFGIVALSLSYAELRKYVAIR
jgi:hypothetical protein